MNMPITNSVDPDETLGNLTINFMNFSLAFWKTIFKYEKKQRGNNS